MSIRFCVRDQDGRRSAMWSLFAMGSNVGLATLEAAGDMKVNLHESGSWQIGYTSEYVERQEKAGKWTGGSRHWEIWQRPEPSTPGYTAALKIVVPRFSLRERPEPKKANNVQWIESRQDKAVTFTIWLSNSSAPPWGYADNHDVAGTILLRNGEYVLIGAHYVDANDATRVMLRGLGGFVQTLMAQDTSKLEPLPTNSTLMGFSTETGGLRTITEIALWGLTTAGEATNSTAGRAPLLHEFNEDFSRGLMDIAVPIPPEVFRDRGIDPRTDKTAAGEIAREWNEAKIREIGRLLGLPPQSG